MNARSVCNIQNLIRYVKTLCVIVASIVTVMATVIVGTSAAASEQLLSRFFNETQTLSAVFSQRIVDDTGMTLDAAGGRVYLSRPGKFRWDYFAPGQIDVLEQQIISDSSSIYIYDLDLEQVTQRSIENALSQIPSLSLVESEATVEEHFNLTDIGLTDGMSWVALTPKDPDAGFQQIMVGFENELMSAITMLDVLGNETRLTLRDVRLNPQFAPEWFDFTVPQGVDLLEQ